MKKSIAITFLFMFMLAIGSPIMAMDTVQEPVKTEKSEKCATECKKACPEKKECTKEKKAECEKQCTKEKK